MDARQYAIELRDLMREARWPSGTAELVLGSRVYVVCDGLEEEEIPTPPFAFLHVGDYTADPGIPELLSQEFHVVVVIPSFNDRLGEGAVLGGPRSGSVLGSTLGRGILEVSRALLAPVRRLTGADGLPIQVGLGGGSKARPIGQNGSLVAMQHVLKAVVTADPEWLPVPWFTATKNGSNVDLAWSLPPQISAFRRVTVRRASGSTPPPNVSTGSEAYIGTGTSVTDTNPGFPVSYSIFACYQETGAAEDQAYSTLDLPHTYRTVTS